jgi:hypothetical protein
MVDYFPVLWQDLFIQSQLSHKALSQWRSQPEHWSCYMQILNHHYSYCFHGLRTRKYLHSMTKLSGRLRHCSATAPSYMFPIAKIYFLKPNIYCSKSFPIAQKLASYAVISLFRLFSSFAALTANYFWLPAKKVNFSSTIYKILHSFVLPPESNAEEYKYEVDNTDQISDVSDLEYSFSVSGLTFDNRYMIFLKL